jgi:hypothetical protein
MKKMLAVSLMVVSASAFADRPFECNEHANSNSAVACDQTPIAQQEFATVPSPGTFALMALALTGLIISRRSRK